MTKGIYRFDPTLYAALIDTEMSGNIPDEILMRLPEWCLYIETPGLMYPGMSGSQLPMFGAWVSHCIFLDAPPLLSILPDTDDDSALLPETLLIPLDNMPVEHAVQKGSRTAWGKGKGHAPVAPGEAEPVAELLKQIINLVLYLCADETEYTRNGLAARPKNPVPVKTRRHGQRIYPADGLTTWDVGVRLGAALRAAHAQSGHDSTGEGHSPRPHIRRAHWHTFVSGLMKRSDGSVIPPEQRRREIRWMPPIPVNIDFNSLASLPATIRPVPGRTS
jgi:hypothetical protein